MYLGTHALRTPDKAAVIAMSGAVITFRELDARSNQLAHALRSFGVRRGDHIALFLENHPRYFEVLWAALRSGVYVTPVNSHLTANEAAFIIDDCRAAVLVSSAALSDVAIAARAAAPECRMGLMIDGVADGFISYEATIGAEPSTPLTDESIGALQLYSSGTTGRPKSVVPALPTTPISEGLGVGTTIRSLYGIDADTVYLSPAPLYHAAPAVFCIGVLTLGGTVVMLERFDPMIALQAIETHRVTHSQWVPTMFIRMLALPTDVRNGRDLTSHRVAIHAAAPCPVHVKQAMIDWWGPIIVEYYGGSEGIGTTRIDSAEWLAHRGSVGRSTGGTIHVCDDDGNEVAIGQQGLVYFEHTGDPERTAAAANPNHRTWATYGDIGYVDSDAYLYLTDRSSFMIVSGGVNIYPREVEDVLGQHPAVADVAVIGVPNDEFGEEVKAIAELWPGRAPSEELATELIDFTRSRLASFKCPRSVDFVDQLPRMPTGKLAKRHLREAYWAERTSRIV